MSPKGTYVMVGGPNDGRWIGPLARAFKASLLSRFVSQNLVFFVASINKEDYDIIVRVGIDQMFSSGRVQGRS